MRMNKKHKLKENLLIICTSLLLLLAGVSCIVKKSYGELVEKQLTEIFSSSLNSYRCVVLIPDGGCTGCVQQAENYFLHQQNNKEILFIFTNYPSRKALTIKFGKELLARTNVWLDNDNLLYFSEYSESIYPCVIFLKEGTVDYFANFDKIFSEK